MRRLGFHLLSAVLVCVFLAGLFEAVVRLGLDTGMQYDLEMWKYAREGKRISDNPEIGHEHVPGAAFRAMGVDVSLNAHGMRDTPVEAARPPGTFRIMMLGDSLTFGWGVKQEETYSQRLELLLNEAGVKAEVLNTGVGNTNTRMQVAYFLDKGHAFAPDLVVLNYFINDAEEIPRHGVPGFLARHSYAWNYFRARFDVLLRMMASRKGWTDYYRDLYGSSGHWAQARDAIDRLAAFCKANGIKLVIVNYPELRQLQDYPFPDVNEKVRRAAVANDVPFLELLPAVADRDPATLWVTRPDPHPNGRANALFAAALFEGLKQRNLLPAAVTAR